MEKQKIINMFENLCKLYNIELDVPVVINKRFTRTLGCVRFTRNKITLETKPIQVDFAEFLENESNEIIEQVVLHEFAHYYLTKKTKRKHSHRDEEFKAFCEYIGCKESGYAIKRK